MWRLKKKWGRLHQHMTQEMNRNTIICYSIYTYCTVYAYRLGKSLWTVDSGCHIHRIYTHNCFEMLQTSEQVLSKKNNSVGRAMIPKWSQEAFPVCRVSYYIPPNPHPKKKNTKLNQHFYRIFWLGAFFHPILTLRRSLFGKGQWFAQTLLEFPA